MLEPNAFIPVSLTPSRITVKISPSLAPCIHVASTRFAGFGLSWLPAFPSPWPVSPWQDAQFEPNSLLPAAIDVASAATVFVGLVACADAVRAASEMHPHASNNADNSCFVA